MLVTLTATASKRMKLDRNQSSILSFFSNSSASTSQGMSSISVCYRLDLIKILVEPNYEVCSQDGTAAEASQPLSNEPQSIESPSQDHTPHDQVLGKRQNNLWRGMKGDLAFLDALPRQLSSALSY